MPLEKKSVVYIQVGDGNNKKFMLLRKE